MPQQANMPGMGGALGNYGQPAAPGTNAPAVGGLAANTGQNMFGAVPGAATASPGANTLQAMMAAKSRVGQPPAPSANAMAQAWAQARALGPGQWTNVGGQLQRSTAPSPVSFNQGFGR